MKVTVVAAAVAVIVVMTAPAAAPEPVPVAVVCSSCGGSNSVTVAIQPELICQSIPSFCSQQRSSRQSVHVHGLIVLLNIIL